MNSLSLNSDRPWLPRKEVFLLRLLSSRVVIIDMSHPHEMVREIDDIAGTLRNWGLKDLSVVDVVVKLHEFLQKYLNFLWFSHFPRVRYDSIRNHVIVSRTYFNHTEKVRFNSDSSIINLLLKFILNFLAILKFDYFVLTGD